MRVRVLYFGILKDVFGADRDVAELADGSTVADLLAVIAGQSQVRPDLWSSVAVAVNQEYVRASTRLQDDDEVALLPPVSGGARENGADAR